MFFKKNYENLIYLSSFIFIIFFYLYSKNSLFSHWSDILDQDVTLIYNSILIGSTTPQEYLDHPAFTTFFILNIFYKIGYLVNLIEIKNFEEFIAHSNKNDVLQRIHNISQFVHLLYSLILILLFKRIINRILNDHLSSFFLSLIFLLSPSFIFLFDIIRSEILSIIFLFLFLICLEYSLRKNLLFIILAGIFFVCALLAKVQIILCIFPILLIFIIYNYNFKGNKQIYVSKITKIILNILFVIFIIAIIDNYFYKRIDKIFFLFIVICLILTFSILDKKLTLQNNTNLSLFLFFVGCSIAIIGFKFLSKVGIAYFHPALIDIITSPISQMSNISTGYGIGRADNFEYLYKIKNFFLYVRETRSDKGIETISFLFEKFNIFTYFLSFLFLCYLFIKKNYLKTILILTLTISIISIILIFNFRPYFFYDIYILPLNLLLISILIQNIPYKKIFTFSIFLIYFIFNSSNINTYLDQKRVSGVLNYKVNLDGNMKFICKDEEIMNKNSYMRYWHKKYDEKFLRDLCSSYFQKIN